MKWHKWLNTVKQSCKVMYSKDADWKAYTVDQDQTAPCLNIQDHCSTTSSSISVCFIAHQDYLSHLMTKRTKWSLRPAKTQICPVWSASSLSTWRNIGSSATHGAHCEDSDQSGRMPRLIWVFAGCKVHLVGFVMKQLLLLILSKANQVDGGKEDLWGKPSSHRQAECGFLAYPTGISVNPTRIRKCRLT